ncbi:MAG: HAMP domain-containing histidine kinase [Bacteroidales bacterium]|nr:HAMP domain-containing histidine kinase [Bacteroidales bacterium]
MNKRVIITIIILSSISLIAALTTQIFWANDAISLKRDQFADKVNIALKSVVNQLMVSNSFDPAHPSQFDPEFYSEHQGILTVVDPTILDSLLQVEMEFMRIGKSYSYGVYRLDDSVFIMGDLKSGRYELLKSEHQISLSCLCENFQYLLSVHFPDQRSIILHDMIILPVMSGLFLLVLVFSFFFTIYALIRQKKLSEMKTDFVNNMTHEFKTPISTISAASEMLGREQVYTSSEKVLKYSKIIFDENKRLKTQVERVLQIATVERGDVKLKIKEINAHEILMECIKNFQVQVQERNGVLKTCLHAEQVAINVDRAHLVNVFNNLMDNANKYSPDNPHITVTTQNVNGSLHINFRDKGIGISKDEQHHIFKKFHRLQSGDIHDVKGFGIGLFYVKRVVEEMGGKISVSSAKSKGSTFTVEFPIASQKYEK